MSSSADQLISNKDSVQDPNTCYVACVQRSEPSKEIRAGVSVSS